MIEFIKELPYPNYTLNRTIELLHSKVLKLSSYSECAKYSIPKSVLTTIQFNAKISDQLLNEVFDKKKVSKWLFFTSTKVLTLYVLTIYYLYNKNEQLAIKSFQLLALQIYSTMMSKYFKICNEDAMKYALNLLKSTSMAKKYGTIAFPLVISKRVLDKYKHQMVDKSSDKDFNLKVVAELRHRINQAVKNFARIYYKVMEKVKAGEDITFTSLTVSRANILATITTIVNQLSMSPGANQSIVNQVAKLRSIDKTTLSNLIESINLRRNDVKLLLTYIGKSIANVDDYCNKELKELFKFVYRNRSFYKKLTTLVTSLIKTSYVRDIPSNKINDYVVVIIIYYLIMLLNALCR